MLLFYVHLSGTCHLAGAFCEFDSLKTGLGLAQSLASLCAPLYACLQVEKTLSALQQVQRERVESEADLRLRREMRMVVDAR